jgi:hypothetical protein
VNRLLVLVGALAGCQPRGAECPDIVLARDAGSGPDSAVPAPSTDAGTTDAGPWPVPVEAESLGPGYRFVLVAGAGRPLYLAAEGGGPPIVVSVDLCSSVSSAALPQAYADWHVSLLGDGRPMALACDATTCALFAMSDRNGELGLVPGSEIDPGDWVRLEELSRFASGQYVERLVCLTAETTRRCFGSDGWGPVETGPFLRQYPFEPPACEDLTLVFYVAGVGVTSDGRLVTVDNGPDAGRRCTLYSEPLGTPIALVDFACGLSSNLWLVTALGVYREVRGRGSGCSCPID